MARGKSINLFLMDGNASGRIKSTLANWTGIAYKIPRTELDKCNERVDLKQSGVYFLFGNIEETDENVVYIGQAGSRKNGTGILNRLQEHRSNSEKDYWTEAVVFMTSDDSFGPTEISYLENRFCELASEAKRYVVKNANSPTSGNVTEEKQSELEEFIDNGKIIMGSLGHKVFDPLISPSSNFKNDSETSSNDCNELLYFNYSDIKATGKRTSDGFVVLKGSSISKQFTKSCPERVFKNREKYSSKIDENSILIENILFKSPSSAAEFVGGASLNGYGKWCNKNGVTLKKIESISKQ